MRVDILYFGVLRDLFGAERAALELAPGTDVATLLRLLQKNSSNQTSGASRLLGSIAVAVNHAYAEQGTMLQDGDEVALLPPVSGGLDTPRMRVEILDTVLPTAEVLEQIKAGPDGAVCVFDGIVRNNTRGRQTLYLDYEAYREMALAQMHSLAEQAVTRFSIRDVALLHRLGRLHVGESSVLIVVASAHRGAAFDACRWLIDTLKKQVPIWKKETFTDGAVWADGEPFPEGIALSPQQAARP